MGNDDDDIDYVFGILFLILDNVIRVCPANLSYYRECNTVDILKGYLQLDEAWQFFSMVVLAYVATDSEKKELASTETGVGLLIKIFEKAVAADSHTAHVGPDQRAVIFSAFEVLDAINHLAVNDAVKTAVESYKGGITSIVRMLQEDFSADEQKVAAEALWNLAFIESIRQSKILQATVPRLKELAKSHITDLRGASASALFEIQGGITYTDVAYQEAIFEPRQSNFNRSVQIIISYQWDIQERAIQIKDMLLSAGYTVWMDVTHMRGDTLEAMAKAVETSDVILYCMTERYKDSKPCRLEAEYAYKLNKKMIPLLLQEKYKPDGWLGILLGYDLYYKFHTEMSEEGVKKSMDGLLQAISEHNHTGDQTDGSTTAGNEAATPNTTPSKPNSSAGEWSKEEVQQWLKDNDLTEFCEKFKVFDGRHLAKMYEQCCKDEDKFEQKMKLNYNMVDAACMNFIVNLQDAFK